MVEILCIIPARSGSKGIHNKNIMDFKGKPLLAWSIEQAQNCKYNMKIVVSTDSQEYANIAINYGAEVPFLRPNNISDDLSTDFEFINHCVEWLKNNENYNSDIILQLRPTSPTRKIEDINKALEIFIKNRYKYDSLRSVILFEKSPFKMYSLNDNILVPLFNEINNIQEPYNKPRQILPQCYLHNGYIDILNTSILNENTISGKNILPFIMDEKNNVDIDNVKDLIL
uniref:Acylneuraminate Cytidylyltransferase Family Protein n=1 Tax=Florenciella sp. virus SA2 TaxID=3240092 RepID=A0AB39JFD5_9VIRU